MQSEGFALFEIDGSLLKGFSSITNQLENVSKKREHFWYNKNSW